MGRGNNHHGDMLMADTHLHCGDCIIEIEKEKQGIDMSATSDKRIRRKVRRSYIISTVSIALVLFILGAVSYVTLSAINAAENLREKVVVSVEITDGLDKEAKREIFKQIKSRDEVANIEYLSKDEKLADEEFCRQFELDIYEILDYNPLRDSFEVLMTKEAVSEDSVRDAVVYFNDIEGVEYVSVPPMEVVDTMHSTLSTIIVALLIFLGVLLMISLLLLNNTIRLAIYSKRYLINTMKLVGATKWYIMRPFLGSAFWQGVLSGVVAGMMLIGLVYGASYIMPVGVELLDQRVVAIITGGLVLLGVLISVVFSAVAVNKFVNMKTNKIHLY